MAADTDVSELLLRWRELRQQDGTAAPEDLCRDNPHLLDELKRRIAAIEVMERQLGMPTVEAVPQKPADSGTLTAADASRSPPPLDLPDSVPDHELLGPLDQGGMGVVYKARHIKLKRVVAVKMIRADAHARPQQLARFHREAEAVAQLQHPNIVQIYQVGEAAGRPFFSMEFVEGGSLAQKLGGRPLPPVQAAELAATVAEAIAFAHERGVVHRDLKPANVLLTKDGVPKVADFGLAKRLNSDGEQNITHVSGQTQSGVILGTPSYMAPEQAAGKSREVGPSADVYALGALLYEMLTGKPPFTGVSPLDTLLRVLSEEPIAPSHAQPQVPRDLETICLKCLEKKPHRRYASARELAQDLRRFLNGAPITARSLMLWRPVRWARRRRALVGVVAAIVLVAVGAAVWNFWSQYQEAKELRETAVRLAPQVRTLLHRYCYSCHGKDPNNTEGDLNVLDYRLLLDPDHKWVVPDHPEQSELIRRIMDNSMPPDEEEEFPRLPDEDRPLIRKWVLGGAPAFADLATEPLPPEEPPSPLAEEVKQLFITKCRECHRSGNAKKGIKILNLELLVKTREVIRPHDPDGSLLFQLITGKEPKRLMPPRNKGIDPLTPKEIALVREWIEKGAPAFVPVRAGDQAGPVKK